MSDNDWCLYVIVRTNLESMNPGKAQAHSGHAANAFVFNHLLEGEDETVREAINEWMGDRGFGTQFNLKAADWDDVYVLEEWADSNDYPNAMIVDPTYPFEVTEEIFNLLDRDQVEVHAKRNGKYICYREEYTAYYIFGRRSDRKLSEALKPFKRHP